MAGARRLERPTPPTAEQHRANCLPLISAARQVVAASARQPCAVIGWRGRVCVCQGRRVKCSAPARLNVSPAMLHPTACRRGARCRTCCRLAPPLPRALRPPLRRRSLEAAAAAPGCAGATAAGATERAAQLERPAQRPPARVGRARVGKGRVRWRTSKRRSAGRRAPSPAIHPCSSPAPRTVKKCRRGKRVTASLRTSELRCRRKRRQQALPAGWVGHRRR